MADYTYKRSRVQPGNKLSVERVDKDDSFVGRIKGDIAEIRRSFAGKGARTRQDKYDRQLDEAELGARRKNQSRDW